MKRVIAFILVFSVSICGFVFPDIKASADNDGYTFIEYIAKHASDFDEQVDVSSYIALNNWTLDDVKLQLRYFYLSEPELFYVDREIAIQYSKDLSKVILNLEYLHSQSEVKKMKSSMKRAALKAIENITEDMTTAEKALVVHDYIILNTSYDHNEEMYSAYDCLVRKSAVCQGYSLAFVYIMRDILGYDCEVVFTDTQNHSWNALKIGKYWYHVDLTADDPTFSTASGKPYDGGGEILHENFLLSDEGIYASSPLHRDWYTMEGVSATNKRYDNFFWRKTTSAMFKVNGLWYYAVLDENSPGVNYESGDNNDIYTKVCTYDPETGKRKVIKRVSSIWNVYRNQQTGERLDGEYWYTKSFLKLVCVNDNIYYNTSDAIYRINTETGKIKKVYTFNKANMQIFSLVPYGATRFRIVYKPDVSYNNKYITIKVS